MDIKNMKTEEIEALSYLDIAYRILKHEKQTKTTIEIFKEICSILKLSDKQFENLIGDFYTSLTVDKRFLLLDNGKWDLKENHSVKIIIEDELDELDGLDSIEDIDEEIDDEKTIFTEDIDEDVVDEVDELEDIEELDDPELDELDGLTVLDEEEIDQVDL